MTLKIQLGLVAASLFASAFSSAAYADCPSSYNSKYGSGKAHRAFAMTAPGSALAVAHYRSAYSCAWSVNQPTREIAIRLALANCESVRVREDRRGNCRIVKSE